MKNLLTLAMTGLLLSLSHGSFATIVGPGGGCVGGTATFIDSLGPGGGTWSTSNPAIATIGASSGILSAVSAGTVTVSYTLGSAVSTQPYTVSPLPAAITGGPTTLCIGSTATFADATSGGTWSSSSSYYMTVSSTGVATGVHAGLAWVNYTVGTGCMASLAVTVNAAPGVDSVLGASSVCVGSTTTLTDATSGGVWSTSSSAIATVSSGGVVTGVSSGIVTISYSVTGVCGTAVRTHVMSVTSTTSPGSITGTTTLMAGTTSTLADATGGGTWSSSDGTIATISASGVVTGVAPGTCTISYAVSGCSGLAYATTVITVTAGDCISGDVLFTGVAYYGPVRVWLIQYDSATHMLTAVDSIYAFGSGSSAHYQFCGMGDHSFRVKAACDSIYSGTGYTPTYHTASAYWSTATVIVHTTGISDLGKDITMGYGAVTSGPGFIAGDVTTGANKGTAGTIPAVHLLMYVQNNTTGAIMQQTYTDAAGHYSFSNLPTGATYRIYPELINYGTTPYDAISLTSAAPSMTAASFEQHTLSHTITPITSSVANVAETNSSIVAFPNPTSGMLNVNWHAIASEIATVAVTDVTGRQVYNATININKGAGATTINLSGLNNGLYMISVKSASVNYNNKIQIAK